MKIRVKKAVAILTLMIPAIAFAWEEEGAPLDGWILGKIEQDETVLRAALLQADGRDLSLLEQSTRYLPFFLEAPDFGGEAATVGMKSLAKFFEAQRATFLGGGYLYKIEFENGAPLFGLSAGEWEDSSWYSPALDRELEVDPLQTWAGQDGTGFLYASLIAGAPPRLVVYDQKGELKRLLI